MALLNNLEVTRGQDIGFGWRGIIDLIALPKIRKATHDVRTI